LSSSFWNLKLERIMWSDLVVDQDPGRFSLPTGPWVLTHLQSQFFLAATPMLRKCASFRWSCACMKCGSEAVINNAWAAQVAGSCHWISGKILWVSRFYRLLPSKQWRKFCECSLIPSQLWELVNAEIHMGWCHGQKMPRNMFEKKNTHTHTSG